MTTVVGVMGAGAVGCYVGGRLIGAPGIEVVLIGRPRLQQEVRGAGLTLTDLDGATTVVRADDITFETEPSALTPCHVVLVCVKSGHTEGVAETMSGVVGADATVISLQNGVRNADVLREHLPEHTVLAGIVGFNVVTQGDGGFQQTTKGALMVERSDEPRVASVIDALANNGFEMQQPYDIVRHQWSKLLVNLNNAVSALSGAPTRDMVLMPGYRRVVAAVMAEGMDVLRGAAIRPAKLRGIPVGWLPSLLAMPTPLVRLLARAQLNVDPEARSSMWQDLDKGRKTEVDYLNGEIVRIADEHGLRAPLNRRIVQLVHEVERAGSGSPNMDPDRLWAETHA